MYTQDMTLSEAYAIRRELASELADVVRQGCTPSEQLLWDIEDVDGCIFILTA
jgi:hypothetical protein